MVDTGLSPVALWANGQTDAEPSGGTVSETPAPATDDERGRFVAELLARHGAALMRHLTGLLSRRADAEDVLQETCARLLEVEHLDRRGSRARAYMYTIATHLAYDRFRKRAESSIEEQRQGGEPARVEDGPEAIVDFEQGLAVIRATLLQLRPRCRRVFLLRVAEGLDYVTIAERLGVSKRTVEREMRHALDACQRRLHRRRQ